MDYVMEFNNLVYLESKYNQKIELESYINECLVSINEEGESKKFSERAKQAFLGFFEKIKQLFSRFVDTLTRFVAGNQKWLDKNKTIILNNPFKFESVTSYNYPKGVERMVKGAIPAYQNYDSIKDNLISDKATYEWLAKGIGYTEFVYNDGANFAQSIADFFRGGSEQIEFKSNDINMTDIFNYCYEYNKMRNNINTDKNTLEKITNEIIKEIEHKEAELSTKTESTFMEADDNKTSNPSSPTIGTAKTTEPSGNQANPVNSKGVSGDPNSTAASNMKNVDYGNKDANDVKNKNVEDVKNTNNSEELKTMMANLNRYKNAVTAIFTAKLTAAEQCYKSRMKILVAHVNSYLGKQQLNNKIADAATNYKNTEAYKSAPNDIKQELDNFINNAKSAAKQFGNNTADVATKVKDWFKNNFGKLSNTVKDTFSKINKETDVANNIAQEVTANSNTQSGDASAPKT